MNGTAQIFNGVVSFGVYHVNPDIIAPWKVYMLITGLLTLAVGLCFWFFIPNNPMTAYFLTKEERIIAIERLRGKSTGIENKTWKKEQFIEALTDWKCWAFAIYAGSNNVANSLTNMTSLIISQFPPPVIIAPLYIIDFSCRLLWFHCLANYTSGYCFRCHRDSHHLVLCPCHQKIPQRPRIRRRILFYP